MKCQGNHEHEPVVAPLSGLYPPVLAQPFIDGVEKLFASEGNESFEVFVGEAHEDVQNFPACGLQTVNQGSFDNEGQRGKGAGKQGMEE